MKINKFIFGIAFHIKTIFVWERYNFPNTYTISLCRFCKFLKCGCSDSSYRIIDNPPYCLLIICVYSQSKVRNDIFYFFTLIKIQPTEYFIWNRFIYKLFLNNTTL